jgi:hypothetical protein
MFGSEDGCDEGSLDGCEEGMVFSSIEQVVKARSATNDQK